MRSWVNASGCCGTSPILGCCVSLGVNEPYYTYLVNMSTTMTSFSQPEMSVRRRFRDFVDLAKLLKTSFRGYFIPQRPHRNVFQGKIRMAPSFIEERRANLEKYLQQLAVHPIISQSEVGWWCPQVCRSNLRLWNVEFFWICNLRSLRCWVLESFSLSTLVKWLLVDWRICVMSIGE